MKRLPERAAKKPKKGKEAMQKVSRETLTPYINGYFGTLLVQTHQLNQPLHVKQAKVDHLVKFSQALDSKPNIYEAIKVAFPTLDLAGQHKFARVFARGLQHYIKRAMGVAPTGPLAPPPGVAAAPQSSSTRPASAGFSSQSVAGNAVQ